MANTDTERQRFKQALNRIVSKYGDWIGDNRHLQSLLCANTAQFDQIIQFENPVAFRLFLMSKNYTPGEGCSVAAMTVSSSDDDTNLSRQREIHFDRTFVTEHTIVHELFHFLCHRGFGRELKSKVVEGFTEYFTYKIIGGVGSAAAAAAATSDDSTTHVSGYADYTRNIEATRNYLKNNIFSMIKEDREASIPAKGFLGYQRADGFTPHEYAGVDFKNFTKKAYFKGDIQMIQFIKDQSGW